MTTHVSSTAADGAAVTAAAPPARQTATQTAARVPLARLVRVELRKSFDTRSGRWLLSGLGLAALLTTGAIIAWAPTSQLAYSEFTLAIGVPMTIILPIIAVLSVTSEWSQRSGLATFTLAPHRGRVLLAKAVAAVLVTVPAILLSGFASPIDNMPGWLQVIAQANPPKHFLVVSEGVFLKAMPAGEILANTWPLMLIATITLTASALLFRSRME